MARKPKTPERDKVIQEARDRRERAEELWGPIYKRCRADMQFSDPTDPRQWPEGAKRERERAARPCLTFDQTSQFVRQVINTARRNKPALNFLPVDDKSDPKLAEVLKGLAKQTEYSSRAEVAYITALEQATRGGLGYFRLVLKDDEYGDIEGQKCIEIRRIVDFETVLVDPSFEEPDGSDMQWGFVEESMSRDKFTKMWPDAKAVDTDDRGWFTKDTVRVCDYYRVVKVEGELICEQFKISGEEILDQTVFPSQYVPIFPVLGNESWEEGKRNLAGCIRLAKDSQITYNFERNAEYEAVAIGPKAPWTAPVESIEGHEDKWAQANRGNLAYLPFNTIDSNGNPIPYRPERVAPAGVAVGWTNLSERSRQDIQSALGMYQASVGDNPNNQSGRAVLALQDKADIGTFHYIDNLALSISHCGRVLTQVWPVIYDQAQIIRIIAEDDDPQFVQVNPKQPTGYVEQQQPGGKSVISINPGVGRYDVRAVVGPAFMTRQQEAAAELGEMVNGNPQLMAVFGDVLVKLRNYPEADKLARRFKAMLPPQVQQAEQEEGQQIPPEVQAVLQQAQQEIQQLQQALQEAQSGMAAKQMEVQGKLQQTQMVEQSKAQLAQMNIESAERIASMNADVKRDMSELAGAIQLMAKKMEVPLSLSTEVQQDLSEQPAEPVEEKPDPMMMLAQAIAQMNQPKRKRLAIQAPSGEVYQGMVEDDAGEVLQ